MGYFNNEKNKKKGYSSNSMLKNTPYNIMAELKSIPIISTGVKLDGKSIWKIHMDFFFENPFFLNLF